MPDSGLPIRLNRGGFVNQWLLKVDKGYFLIDAGFPQTVSWIKRALARFGVSPADLSGCLLTHGHVDHSGAAPWLQRHGVPVYCGEKEEAYLRGSLEYRYGQTLDRAIRFLDRRVGLVQVQPDKVLKDNQMLAGLRAIDSPGHTAGHMGFWHEKERVLFSGDLILGHARFFQGPSRVFTPDYALALSSMQRMLDLEPLHICPGHGATLDRDKFVQPAQKLLRKYRDG